MAETTVEIESLARYESLSDIPKNSAVAARQAVNRAASRARTAGSRAIRQQVKLPASYVSQNLTLGPPATTQNLERNIVGRFRPTSLARFASGTPQSTQKANKTKVEVHPGNVKYMDRAFLINLKNGNIGLAIRLRKGEKLNNRHITPVKMKNGLTLLYGPSVDQLFRSVRDDIAPDIADFLEQEYLRLMALKGGNDGG